jgi:uncharacterized membrane protein
MIIIIGTLISLFILSCISYCFGFYFDDRGIYFHNEPVELWERISLWTASLSFCGLLICGIIIMWLQILGHK